MPAYNCVGVHKQEYIVSENDKVVSFRPRSPKPKGGPSPDSLNMAEILQNLAQKTGMEDLPMVQALRLKQGLASIVDCHPTQEMIAEQNKVITSWSSEEMLLRAKESTESDWKRWPALYTALANVLFASE